MKFSTSLIERESQNLYLRFIKDPRIPDDLCLEIYEEFMKALGLERTKGKKNITGNFIGQIARFATRTVFSKNRIREDKEEVLTEIVKRNASQFWCQSKSREEKDFMRKIALFLKDFALAKDHHPLYLRVFLLRNAFHITDETLDVLEMSTDLKPSLLSKQLETMKEKIRSDVNVRLQEKMENLGTLCYDQYVTEKDMGDLCLRQFKNDRDEQKYKKIKGNRKKVFELIKKMEFTASFADIRKIGKIEPSQARYAYGRVTDAIKESFKDDTYWG